MKSSPLNSAPQVERTNASKISEDLVELGKGVFNLTQGSVNLARAESNRYMSGAINYVVARLICLFLFLIGLVFVSIAGVLALKIYLKYNDFVSFLAMGSILLAFGSSIMFFIKKI